MLPSDPRQRASRSASRPTWVSCSRSSLVGYSAVDRIQTLSDPMSPIGPGSSPISTRVRRRLMSPSGWLARLRLSAARTRSGRGRRSVNESLLERAAAVSRISPWANPSGPLDPPRRAHRMGCRRGVRVRHLPRDWTGPRGLWSRHTRSERSVPAGSGAAPRPSTRRDWTQARFGVSSPLRGSAVG